MPETIKIGAQGAAVRNLQTILNAIGADLKVDGDFGPITEESVLDFQAWLHLPESGVVDDKIWEELNLALVRHQHMTKARVPVEADARLKDLGEQAVQNALAYWQDDIYDPKKNDRSPLAEICKQIIYDFIRVGTSWKLDGNYDGDGDFQWCTAFAWYCWGGTNLFDPEILNTYAASTYRMDRYGSYRSAFGEKNKKPVDEHLQRLYMKCDEDTTADELPWIPRAGDIALVGPSGYGQHGVLIESVDLERGIIYTIEGNAHGNGPHGEHQQGVVKGHWYFGGHHPKNVAGQKMTGAWHIRRIIRPGLGDLTPARR